MRKFLIPLALIVIAFSALSCYGYSRVEIDKYENNHTKDNQQETEFRVVGAGTFIYAGLFKIYDVILYATTKQANHTSQPLVLEFHYLRHIPKEASVKATEQAILLNATSADVESFGTDWNNLLSFYEDVVAGDTLIIRHDRKGLHMHYRGSEKHTHINNHKLAEKLCAVWIGPKPLNLKLRNALLGTEPE